MRGVRSRPVALALIAFLLVLVLFVSPAPATPITVTVPYSSSAVADADLDGNPASGSWSGATSWAIPLENGAASPYGSATLFAKHDGTYVYLRVDGKMDVAWMSTAGNHFWFGMIFTSSVASHHSSWQDGVFFGEDSFTSAPPLVAVDTNGGGKPPAKDVSQDDLGRMQATGSAVPYSFTAEWKRKLNTGDANDLAFTADGSTSYYFYATTDSNGGGSNGGNINHKTVTNDNVMRFASVPSSDTTPPTVQITAPANGAVVSGTVLITVTATDNVGGSGMASVAFVIDGSTAATDTAAPYQYSWDTTAATNAAHTIRADAKDVAGNTGTTQTSVTVNNVDSTPPVAEAGPSQTVPPVTRVTLDASASTDNVAVTNYTWSFTDGGARTLYGVTVQYTFNNVGSFVITLTVKDGAGNAAMDRTWVNVSADNAPPVARAGPDQAVYQGVLVTLNGSLSTDDVAVANYTWTLTDGSPITLYGPVVQRRFLRIGAFAVTLTVRDFVGKTGTDSVWVNVTADPIPPRAVTCGNHTIRLGQSVTLNGSNSTDDVLIVNYTWSVQGTPTVLYGVVVTYTPSAGGVYRIILTVFDASSLSSSASLNVTVIAPDRTAPAAVHGVVVATSGPGVVLVEWTANTEPDLVGYYVLRIGPDGVPIRLNEAHITNTSFVDAGLVPGQSYDYLVEAVDASGNISPPSDRVTGAAGGLPAEPFDLLSIRWAIAPLATAAAFIALALLARRESRRREGPAPLPPPPPPEVKP